MDVLTSSFKTVTSLFRTQAKQIGLPPGTLIHVGEREMDQPLLCRIDYSTDMYQRGDGLSLEDCRQPPATDTNCWINLDGLHDVLLVEGLGSLVQLHPLALEDILNTNHPPKYEEYPEAILIILKLLDFDSDSGEIYAEQFSLVVTADRLLSFRELSSPLFQEVQRRLENKSGRFRERGADYLAYALMDSVVDSYFHVLEKIGDQLEQIESQLVSQPGKEHLQQIHQLRGQLFFVRKVISPLRELTASLVRSESPFIDTQTRIYLRDLHEHVAHVIDNMENYRDTAKGLIDLSLSNMSYRTNEVMQVLTVIASIFIPLTFIAGVYGMNFEFMPELGWRYGYPLIMAIMLACMIGMLWFFKRKKWL